MNNNPLSAAEYDRLLDHRMHNKKLKTIAFLEKQEKTVNTVAGFTLIGIIGVCDFLMGYEIAFSLFYVLPIAFLLWFTGEKNGLIASFVSAIVWLLADKASGHVYSSMIIPLWNTVIRLSFFIIIVLLLSALRSSIQREKTLARMDNLTGAINSRYFYLLVERELDRFHRYGNPFSLVYIDLDNFKAVNDCSGHAGGDETLKSVVAFIQTHLRRTDIVARLGGDEFALMLPETNLDMAQSVCTKLQSGLLAEMQQHGWPVTFSMGVLTCQDSAKPQSVDELVQRADELMYTVKHTGKNGILYERYMCAPKSPTSHTTDSDTA